MNILVCLIMAGQCHTRALYQFGQLSSLNFGNGFRHGHIRPLKVTSRSLQPHIIIYLQKYRLTFKWNCSEFDTPDDYVRPAYIEKSDGTLKYRPSKLRYEVHIPAHERRKGFGFSCVTILFFLSLVIMAVFSCMFFQLWLSGRCNIIFICYDMLTVALFF